MESVNKCQLGQKSHTMAQFVERRTKFSPETHPFFLKDVTQLCLHIEKVEQYACKIFFCRSYPLMHFNERTGKCMNCGEKLSIAAASNISPGFFL